MNAQFWRIVRKAVSLCVLLPFLVTSVLPAQAQSILTMPAPGVRVSTSPAFNPATLRGLKVYLDNPFKFDFIVDAGDSKDQGDALKAESTRLIKYFLASLTTPEEDMWVNLSPYEKDRIVPESFGTTEMGRDLLAQDYLLKQITASLIYPEDELGKKFWDRVYKEAQEKYGTTDIPVNTFNKVWVVPEKAVIYEHEETAFVVQSHLKVMLEEDYVAMSNQKDMAESPTTVVDVVLSQGVPATQDSSNPENRNPGALGNRDAQDVNMLGSQIVREIVLPELEREVNEGRNFAQLRQVYQSLILATWYKKKLKDSILSKVYVDQKKTAGVDLKSTVDRESLIGDREQRTTSDEQQVLDAQAIYTQYLAAFKKGVYNYIKDDYDAATQEVIPRKYFSGGFSFNKGLQVATTVTTSGADSRVQEYFQKQRESPSTYYYVGEENHVINAEGKTLAPRSAAASNGDLGDKAMMSATDVVPSGLVTQFTAQDDLLNAKIIYNDQQNIVMVGNKGIADTDDADTGLYVYNQSLSLRLVSPGRDGPGFYKRFDKLSRLGVAPDVLGITALSNPAVDGPQELLISKRVSGKAIGESGLSSLERKELSGMIQSLIKAGIFADFKPSYLKYGSQITDKGIPSENRLWIVDADHIEEFTPNQRQKLIAKYKELFFRLTWNIEGIDELMEESFKGLGEASQDKAMLATNDQMLNNPVMKSFRDQRGDLIEDWIKPFVEKDFEGKRAIDNYSDEEVLREINEVLKLENGDSKGLHLYDTTLTFRELFLHPTGGIEDIAQALTNIFLLVNKGSIAAVNPSFSSKVSNDHVYLLIRAMEVLSRKIDEPLFTEADAEPDSPLMRYYLSEDVVAPVKVGNNVTIFDVSPESSQRFLGYSELLIEQLTDVDPRKNRDAITPSFLKAALSRTDRKVVKESIRNYLRFYDKLNFLNDDEGEYFSEAWRDQLMRKAQDDEPERRNYEHNIEMLREALKNVDESEKTDGAMLSNVQWDADGAASVTVLRNDGTSLGYDAQKMRVTVKPSGEVIIERSNETLDLAGNKITGAATQEDKNFPTQRWQANRPLNNQEEILTVLRANVGRLNGTSSLTWQGRLNTVNQMITASGKVFDGAKVLEVAASDGWPSRDLSEALSAKYKDVRVVFSDINQIRIVREGNDLGLFDRNGNLVDLKTDVAGGSVQDVQTKLIKAYDAGRGPFIEVSRRLPQEISNYQPQNGSQFIQKDLNVLAPVNQDGGYDVIRSFNLFKDLKYSDQLIAMRNMGGMLNEGGVLIEGWNGKDFLNFSVWERKGDQLTQVSKYWDGAYQSLKFDDFDLTEQSNNEKDSAMLATKSISLDLLKEIKSTVGGRKPLVVVHEILGMINVTGLNKDEDKLTYVAMGPQIFLKEFELTVYGRNQEVTIDQASAYKMYFPGSDGADQIALARAEQLWSKERARSSIAYMFGLSSLLKAYKEKGELRDQIDQTVLDVIERRRSQIQYEDLPGYDSKGLTIDSFPDVETKIRLILSGISRQKLENKSLKPEEESAMKMSKEILSQIHNLTGIDFVANAAQAMDHEGWPQVNHSESFWKNFTNDNIPLHIRGFYRITLDEQGLKYALNDEERQNYDAVSAQWNAKPFDLNRLQNAISIVSADTQKGKFVRIIHEGLGLIDVFKVDVKLGTFEYRPVKPLVEGTVEENAFYLAESQLNKRFAIWDSPAAQDISTDSVEVKETSPQKTFLTLGQLAFVRASRDDAVGQRYRTYLAQVVPELSDRQKVMGVLEHFQKGEDDELVSEDQQKKILWVIYQKTGEDVIQAAAANYENEYSPLATQNPSYQNKTPQFNLFYRTRAIREGLKSLLSNTEKKEYDAVKNSFSIVLGDYLSQRHPDHGSDTLTQDILELKNNPTMDGAEQFMAQHGEAILERLKPVAAQVDVVLPVPSFVQELNPLYYLAEEIASGIGKEFAPDTLRMVKDKLKQKSLGFWDRFINVRGIFEVREPLNVKESVKGKTVLLLDDVKTSEATLQEAVRKLYEAGAEKVITMVLGETRNESAATPKSQPNASDEAMLSQKAQEFLASPSGFSLENYNVDKGPRPIVSAKALKDFGLTPKALAAYMKAVLIERNNKKVDADPKPSAQDQMKEIQDLYLMYRENLLPGLALGKVNDEISGEMSVRYAPHYYRGIQTSLWFKLSREDVTDAGLVVEIIRPKIEAKIAELKKEQKKVAEQLIKGFSPESLFTLSGASGQDAAMASQEVSLNLVVKSTTYQTPKGKARTNHIFYNNDVMVGELGEEGDATKDPKNSIIARFKEFKGSSLTARSGSEISDQAMLAVKVDLFSTGQVDVPQIDQTADDIVKIEKQSFSAGFRMDKEEVKGYLTSSDWRVLLARDDQNIIGYAIYRLNSTDDPKTGHLYKIAVSSDQRGDGIGTKLTDAVFDDLMKNGKTALTSVPFNQPSGVKPVEWFKKYADQKGWDFKSLGSFGMQINLPNSGTGNSTTQGADGQDQGMLGTDESVGGIDFNADKVNLEIKNDGGKFEFTFDPAEIENMKIEGFVPVIINISPVNNLPLLLGLTAEEIAAPAQMTNLRGKEVERYRGKEFEVGVG